MATNAHTSPIRLPGRGCRHWMGERCLYEEHLNPGLPRNFRCIVLEDWEKILEEHVARSECFGLTAKEAGNIWERMAVCLEDRWECPDFRSDGEASGPSCALLAGDVCLLRLPPCTGRYRRYER